MNGMRNTNVGPSITRNLITHVLTICHVKLTQCKAMKQKRFDLQSLSPALHNLWLLEITICGRQEEHAILISRLVLRMRRLYVATLRLDFHQAVCITTHKGSWVKLLLCLISIVTRSSSHLVRELNQTQGSKHCCLFQKSLRKRAISRIFKIS